MDVEPGNPHRPETLMLDLPSRARLGRLPPRQLLELASQIHRRLTELGDRLVEGSYDIELAELNRIRVERERLLVYYIDLWDAFELAAAGPPPVVARAG